MEKKDLKIKRLKKALDLAIKKLELYSSEDIACGLEGSGVYINPKEIVDEWIKEIRKIEIGENK